MTVADLFAHRRTIIGFPIACGAWLLAGGSVPVLTMVLSVMAITMTQLVLAEQNRDTAAVHRKLDELVITQPGADDSVAGC